MRTFLLFIIIFVTFMASIISLIIRALGGTIQPGTADWDNLINRLRNHTRPLKSTVIPWDGKDLMPLLSFAELKDKSSWLESGKIRVGVINSIFQEPAIALAEVHLGKLKVAVAQTSKHEFVFRMREKDVDIWHNSHPFAVLSGGALLSSGRGSKLLAQVQPTSDERNIPIAINNHMALTLANPKMPPASPNPRALLLLRDLNSDEELAALSLAILYQLRNI